MSEQDWRRIPDVKGNLGSLFDDESKRFVKHYPSLRKPSWYIHDRFPEVRWWLVDNDNEAFHAIKQLVDSDKEYLRFYSEKSISESKEYLQLIKYEKPVNIRTFVLSYTYYFREQHLPEHPYLARPYLSKEAFEPSSIEGTHFVHGIQWGLEIVFIVHVPLENDSTMSVRQIVLLLDKICLVLQQCPFISPEFTDDEEQKWSKSNHHVQATSPALTFDQKLNLTTTIYSIERFKQHCLKYQYPIKYSFQKFPWKFEQRSNPSDSHLSTRHSQDSRRSDKVLPTSSVSTNQRSASTENLHQEDHGSSSSTHPEQPTNVTSQTNQTSSDAHIEVQHKPEHSPTELSRTDDNNSNLHRQPSIEEDVFERSETQTAIELQNASSKTPSMEEPESEGPLAQPKTEAEGSKDSDDRSEILTEKSDLKSYNSQESITGSDQNLIHKGDLLYNEEDNDTTVSEGSMDVNTPSASMRIEDNDHDQQSANNDTSPRTSIDGEHFEQPSVVDLMDAQVKATDLKRGRSSDSTSTSRSDEESPGAGFPNKRKPTDPSPVVEDDYHQVGKTVEIFENRTAIDQTTEEDDDLTISTNSAKNQVVPARPSSPPGDNTQTNQLDKGIPLPEQGIDLTSAAKPMEDFSMAKHLTSVPGTPALEKDQRSQVPNDDIPSSLSNLPRPTSPTQVNQRAEPLPEPETDEKQSEVDTMEIECNPGEEPFKMDPVAEPDSPVALPTDINVLLVGESGVGKSTFINAFVNYLMFDSLEDAKRGEPAVLIPVSFLTTTDHDFKEKTITFGDPNSNENYDRPGHSVTQQCRSYVFNISENQRFRIIDTPGVGDTRGIDQDKKNIDQIIAYVNNFDHVNGICILLKPNTTRMEIHFRTCIMQLFTHLTPNARDNILFCFTNTRSTFFAPGNTGPVLKAFLKQLPIAEVPFGKKNAFCFDSESFRYLACLNNGIDFDEYQRQECVKSWTQSVTESARLFNFIRALPAYNIADWQSEKHAIMQIKMLVRPLMETLRLALLNSVAQKQEKQFIFNLNVTPILDPNVTAVMLYNDHFKTVNYRGCWIPQHPIRYQATDAQLSSDNYSEIIDYKIQYRTRLNKESDPPIIDEVISDYSDAITSFSNFIGSGEIFRVYFDHFLHEQEIILERQKTSKNDSTVNKELHTELLNMFNSLAKVLQMDDEGNRRDLDKIYEWIDWVRILPDVAKQLEAIETRHRRIVKAQERTVERPEQSTGLLKRLADAE